MRSLLVVLISILPFTVFSQANYYPGFVLKNNGDTIRGYINYHEWIRSPKSIDFKINKADRNMQQFDPLAIKEFRINGFETYISYIGIISMNKTTLSDLQQGLDTSKKTDTIFLKQVVTGSHLTLFYHGDKIKTRFFIAENHARPVELLYFEYLKDANQILNLAVYKRQLLAYTNNLTPENSKLMLKIEQINYNQTDLEHVIDEINGNLNIKKKLSNRYFAGIAINSTITETNYVNGANYLETYTSISPQINAGVDIFVNPNVQRLIIRAEVSFSYTNPTYKYLAGLNGYSTNDTYSFNQYTGSFTPQLLFNIYNKDNFKIYIDGGVSLNLSNYTNNKNTFINSLGGTTTQENPYKLEPFWISFPVQAGLILRKRIEIFCSYSGFASFTTYSSYYAGNRSTSAGLKYLFGK